MADQLSGFAPVEKIGVNLGPQSIRVPANKADALTSASAMLEALWDAVDNDVSPNVTIEVLKHDGTTFCRVSPWQSDGVTKTVANPGDWLVVDGTRLIGMTDADFSAQYVAPVA